MRYTLECTYCGNTWEDSFFHKDALSYVRCSVCKDKNIKVKPWSKDDTDPFGYNYKEKKNVPKT